jgi:AcrR family transcriptional regulator
MGRPREHDQRTAEALLDAAERIVTAEGVEALSVRRVADDVGTTTRAVYSLFGSKDGLLVALGARAFDMLGVAIRAMPRTTDPSADLIEAGVAVFRNFAVGHPSLFKIAVQRSIGSPGLSKEFAAAASAAFLGLLAHVARLETAGELGRRTVRDAATEFHALCEGLAALELRSQLTTGDNERIWRDALTALVIGFSAASEPPAPTRPDRGRQSGASR